jgi:hypothetical protein
MNQESGTGNEPFIPQSEFRPALHRVQGSPEPYMVQGAIRNAPRSIPALHFLIFLLIGSSPAEIFPADGPQPPLEFLVGMLRGEGDRHLAQRFRAGNSPKSAGGDIPADHGPRLDHRPFADPHVGENDAVGAYEHVLFDDHLGVVVFFPGSPVEMGEDGGAKADGAMIPYGHIFRVQLINIDQLGDPHLLPQMDPPHAVQKGPQAPAPRANHGDFMDNPVEQVPYHTVMRIDFPAPSSACRVIEVSSFEYPHDGPQANRFFPKAGERKKLCLTPRRQGRKGKKERKTLSLAEPAGFAEKTRNRNSCKTMFFLLEYCAFPVYSACSSEAGERKNLFD